MQFYFPIHKPHGAVFPAILLLIFSITPLAADYQELLASGTPEEVRKNYWSIAESMKRDAFGWTPLMIAAAEATNPEVIHVLIEEGEDPHAMSLDGWTALMFAAAFNSRADISTALLEAGSDIEKRTEDSWTPLTGAARYTGKNIRFNALQNIAPAAPGGRESGWSALFFSARFNPSAEVTAALLSCGADPESRDEYYKKPYHYAIAENPVPELLKLLKAP